MLRFEERRSSFLSQEMPFGRGETVGCLPFFGAFEERRNLLFKSIVVKLGRERDGTTPPFAMHLEGEALVSSQRSLVLIAVSFDVGRARAGEIAVVEAHRRTVRVQVNDDTAGSVAHGPSEGPADGAGWGETKMSASLGRTSRKRS